MNTPHSMKPSWRWTTLALGAVLLTISAWGIGRAGAGTSGSQSRPASTGFDIGVASKPVPTGTLREFQLVAQEAMWEIAPGVPVAALTYNGQTPGPLIRVTEGDTLRVILRNELSQETTIHWHGLHVPNNMDGVPLFSQAPIKPGESFTYEFIAPHAGTRPW